MYSTGWVHHFHVLFEYVHVEVPRHCGRLPSVCGRRLVGALRNPVNVLRSPLVEIPIDFVPRKTGSSQLSRLTVTFTKVVCVGSFIPKKTTATCLALLDQRPFVAREGFDEFGVRGRVLEIARVPGEPCWGGREPTGGGNEDEGEETEEQEGGQGPQRVTIYKILCFMHENIVKPMNGRGSGGAQRHRTTNT